MVGRSFRCFYEKLVAISFSPLTAQQECRNMKTSKDRSKVVAWIADENLFLGLSDGGPLLWWGTSLTRVVLPHCSSDYK